MNNIGIIGFGSMGKMLTNGFLLSGIIPQENLFISSRTVSKAESLKEHYKAVTICIDNIELVKKSDIIFLCTPPNQVKSVLLEISGVMTENKHLVSIAAYVSLNNIESIINGQISKVIPSFVSEVNEGVFLVCHNKKISNNSKVKLNKMLSKLGILYEIDESQFEIYTDITSCSPGIFSSIFSEFIKSACKHGSINSSDALVMFIQTLYGLSKLYKEKHIDFNETINRVARKGGITEIGISVVNDKAPALFNEIFEKTLEKHEIRKQEFRKEFS